MYVSAKENVPLSHVQPFEWKHGSYSFFFEMLVSRGQSGDHTKHKLFALLNVKTLVNIYM